MPPKPFPFPISVGNDICQISRIFHLLNGQHKNRFLSKLFTAKELNAFRTRIFLQDGEEQDYQKFKSLKSVKREDLTGSSKSMQSTGPEGEIQTESVASFEELRKAHPNFWKRASFVAGRWAAKEAVMKAHMGIKKLTMHDIHITPSKDPIEGLGETGSLPPQVGVRLSDEVYVSAQLSISHDGDYAVAMALAANDLDQKPWYRLYYKQLRSAEKSQGNKIKMKEQKNRTTPGREEAGKHEKRSENEDKPGNSRQ